MITRVATEQMKTEISASAQVATAVQDANIIVVKANATAGVRTPPTFVFFDRRALLTFLADAHANRRSY